MCVDLNILRFIFSILQFKDIIHQIWTFCNLYFQIAQNIIHQMFSDKFFPLSGKQSEDDADDPERRDQIWAYWALILHQLEKNSAWNQLKKATSGSLNHLTFFLSYTAAWQTLTLLDNCFCGAVCEIYLFLLTIRNTTIVEYCDWDQGFSPLTFISEHCWVHQPPLIKWFPVSEILC